MSIQTVEISLPESIIKVVEIRQGPAGPGGGGTNSVTSATTSDGTANLYLDSIRFEATNGGPTQLGEMAWESTDGSIDAMLESGVIVAMGEDLVIRVRNTTASLITKGTALAYDGTSGASGRIEVKPWVGANIPTAKLFLGFAACDMPANSNGYSQWFGKLAEINTSGGAQTWLDEQIIYAVPGASATITNVAPTSGKYAAAAVVINAGSGTSGILFVRPTFEVASSTSATANTLVLRNNAGGATLYNLICDELDVGNGKFQASALGNVTFGSGATVNFNSTTYTYGSGAASAHRIALGAGTTGEELFGAATAAAARTTLGLLTATSTAQIDSIAYVIGGNAVTGLQNIQLEADTLYEVSWYGKFTSNGGSGYIWLNFSSPYDDLGSSAFQQFARFHTTTANVFLSSTSALGAAFANLGTQTNRTAHGSVRFKTVLATQISVGWSQWNSGTVTGTSSLLTGLRLGIRPV